MRREKPQCCRYTNKKCVCQKGNKKCPKAKREKRRASRHALKRQGYQKNLGKSCNPENKAKLKKGYPTTRQ